VRPGEGACPERSLQRGLVDEPAPADVDQPGARGHGGELGRAQHPAGLFGQGCDEHDIVRLRQQPEQVAEGADLAEIGVAAPGRARCVHQKSAEQRPCG
jgi:hypothetical protein